MTRDLRGLARLISQLEARQPSALAQLKALHHPRRAARVIGVTGPPGAGKSTLVDHLIRCVRRASNAVAVIAIDPSSPWSGGAVLGDRIRMQSHAGDDHVFIRSVGTRGAHGGLSRSTRGIVDACAAYHFDWIIIETVGVGQSEYDIMDLADTTLVVLTPESGDTVQTLKAGLLEIADIFIVNKGDRPGADQMQQLLSAMVHLDVTALSGSHEQHDRAHRVQSTGGPTEPRGWRVPVVRTTATLGSGIEEVMTQINHHAAFVAQDATAGRRTALRRRRDFLALCAEGIVECLHSDPRAQSLIAQVAAGSANPYEAMEQLVATIFPART